ncbi:MAG TPA: IPT/TIG domain-containing protein [Thermoanaerobaculia bacterium]|nr:IPT/TIG domain-containing protein [Thermoanaerobaculia bacterium]
MLPFIAVDSHAEAARPLLRTVEGTLIVVWADPHPDLSTAGGTRYSLALDDGTIRELKLNGQESAALLNFGKRVTVSTFSGPDSNAIAVQSITRSLAAGPPGGSPGTKKVLYLLLQYADDVDVPHPPSFYSNLNNPDTPPVGEVFPSTINGFFKKTSWGQFSWIGDVGGAGGLGAPGGWLTLPHPKSHYAPCGWETSCADLNTLTNDAMELGRAEGIDLSVYDNVNFVMSNDLDCCAHGGGFYSPIERKFYGATWEPPWGQEAHIYAHEMGHSLGLPHSGWVYYAYDNPWDVMSRRSLAANVLCGSYPSANNGGTPRDLYCAEPGNGYIAPHKNYLNWIPAANAVVTNTSANTTVTLEGLALPLGAAAKILTVCIDGVPCTGPSAHYFTVEARVRDLGNTSQFDNGIVGEGVIIHEVRMDQSPIGGHCYFNSQSGFAFPVDSTPGDYDSLACSFAGYPYPEYALFNAQWNPGQTYTNGFSLSVLSRTASTFVVSTTGMPPPALTAVSPNTGTRWGGTNVVITGTSFVPGMTVSIGGSEATNVVVVNATTITARTPPHAAGNVNVIVTNPLGQRSTLPNGYLYSESVVPFTDDPLVAGVTVVKRVHLTELRTRIDALRARYGGLPAFTYTDPAITAGVTRIRAQHIVELRQALAPAYLAATGTTATYATDPSLAAGAGIRHAHISELRARVLTID